MFCRIVAVAAAQVRRDGRVQAQGSPAEHATLGPAEEWLDRQAGPGVIDWIADRAVLRGKFVKRERKRLLTRPMLRSGSPELVRQELAARAAATEMTRGVARAAAAPAVPARKGRRAGRADTATRTAPAVITLANTPA